LSIFGEENFNKGLVKTLALDYLLQVEYHFQQGIMRKKEAFELIVKSAGLGGSVLTRNGLPAITALAVITASRLMGRERKKSSETPPPLHTKDIGKVDTYSECYGPLRDLEFKWTFGEWTSRR